MTMHAFYILAAMGSHRGVSAWIAEYPGVYAIVLLGLFALCAFAFVVFIYRYQGRRIYRETADRFRRMNNFSNAISHNATDIFILDINKKTSTQMKAGGTMLQSNHYKIRPYYDTW